MPKTRPYNRDELQGLRRADLQRLCKTYDIKGANAKTDVLVETLAKFFASPAYLSSPRPDRARRQPNKITATRTLHPIPRRKARPDARPPRAGPSTAASGNLSPRPSASAESFAPALSAAPEQSTLDTPQASTLPSAPLQQNPGPMADEQRDTTSTSPELSTLREEVHRLTDVIAAWQRDQEALIDRMVDARVQQRLQEFLAREMSLLEEREASVRKREAELEHAMRQFEAKLCALENAEGGPIQSESLRVPAGMRVPSSGEKRRHAGDESPSPSKRPRHDVPTSPRTPPPGYRRPPHTPSPHSVLDAVARRHGFTSPPHLPIDLPSPTINRTPHRIPSVLPGGASGSRSVSRSIRASKAQADLAIITDTHAGQAVSDFTRTDPAATPPALSPSPSITDKASYTTMPMPGDGPSQSQTQLARMMPSPRGEYMDVALNGLHESPSAFATPNSRTLLGTERYRDTRFGDEPFVPWTSPTVDCGPPTPHDA